MLSVLSDNFYDYTDKLIDNNLDNIHLRKNHTSNNIRSLKYVYLKSKILKTEYLQLKCLDRPRKRGKKMNQDRLCYLR